MALTAVDVYAGGGGLTVGLKRAGFDVVGAIELEEHAYATYKANHPKVVAVRQDVGTVSGPELLEQAGVGEVDLLAGCPPCQGFTSLTAKYRRRDQRNELVLEMARLAEELLPVAIMMENVPGLTIKGRNLYGAVKRRLRRVGYRLTEGILEVADYGVPQFRRRLVLVGGRGFRIELPEATHGEGGRHGRALWRTVRDAIGHLGSPRFFDEAKKRGEVEKLNWHVVRRLSTQNMARMKSVAVGGTWRDIPEELRPPCHQDGYVGFTNVYGRMVWDRPAPTITGGCTTFSKGRFGHPSEERTLSVHEAALLQTFPSTYVFDTPYMEYVSKIVGNALPCDFAEAVSSGCYAAICAWKEARATGRSE